MHPEEKTIQLDKYAESLFRCQRPLLFPEDFPGGSITGAKPALGGWDGVWLAQAS